MAIFCVLAKQHAKFYDECGSPYLRAIFKFGSECGTKGLRILMYNKGF
jgi:hypothetical protein